jgi:YegS/Rv2252/BmrU family lipid kinase
MLTGRVIYNPAAGQVATQKMIRRAAQELESNGWQVEVLASRSGTHTQELAQQAADAGLDALFVAGGDGSVRAALEGLVGSHTALGTLPSGTMNVWAQELGLPRLTWLRRNALTHSAKALANGRIQVVDVGMCGQHPFLLWAGVGLDGVIVNQMEGARKGRRHFSLPKYLATAAWKVSSWKGLDMRLDVDGTQINGHYLFAVMSNSRSYAGGLAKISPQAFLDDGEMELWLFRGDSIRRSLQHAWRLLRGEHVRSPEVEFVKFRQLSMVADSPLVAQLDGDPFTYGTRLDVRVRSQALRALLPKDAPEELFSRPGTQIGGANNT